MIWRLRSLHRRAYHRIRCRICRRWLGLHDVTAHDHHVIERARQLESTQRIAHALLARDDLSSNLRALCEDLTRHPWDKPFPSGPEADS